MPQKYSSPLNETQQFFIMLVFVFFSKKLSVANIQLFILRLIIVFMVFKDSDIFFLPFLEEKCVICSVAKILAVVSVESLKCIYQVAVIVQNIFFSYFLVCVKVLLFSVDHPLRLALNDLSRICFFCLNNSSVLSSKSSISIMKWRI